MGETQRPRPGRDTHGTAHSTGAGRGGGRWNNEPIGGQVGPGKRSASSAGGGKGRALLSPRQPNHHLLGVPGLPQGPPTLRNTHPSPQHGTRGAAYGPVLDMGHQSLWRRVRTQDVPPAQLGHHTHTHARTGTHAHTPTHAGTPGRGTGACRVGPDRPGAEGQPDGQLAGTSPLVCRASSPTACAPHGRPGLQLPAQSTWRAERQQVWGCQRGRATLEPHLATPRK